MVFVAEKHAHKRLLVLPEFAQLIVGLFGTHVALLAAAVLFFGLGRMSGGVAASRPSVSGLLPFPRLALLVVFVVSVDEEYFAGSLLFEPFALLLATEIGTFLLG